MERSSGKRPAAAHGAPKTVLPEAAIEENSDVQFCNRIGCNGRIRKGKNAKMGIVDKDKTSKPCEVNGKSSTNSSAVNIAKKSNLDSKRKSVSQGSHSNVPESMPSPTSYRSKSSRKKPGEVSEAETGSSSLSSNRKMYYHQKSGFQNQNSPSASADPLASKQTSRAPYNSIQNRSRYSLRNLKCNSGSDAVPASSSSSSSSEPETVGKNMMKQRNSEGESNLSRRGLSNNGISISDARQSSSSGENSRGGTTTVWARRSTRLPSRQDRRNGSSLRDVSVGIPQVRDEVVPFSSIDGQNSVRHFSANTSRSSTLSRDNLIPTMPFAYADPEFTQSMGSDMLYRYNIDGIAEVLLALERIEQDGELTHEVPNHSFSQQALSLETSLFLSSLNLYDRHRDMRLDIDNMSYEELLALEERMGSVSTALSEEALSNCLKTSIYLETPSKVQTTEDGDDTKCTICQEEFAVGDELGKLVECQHGYHLLCINQWLQMKNWCPICKASAAPSSCS